MGSGFTLVMSLLTVMFIAVTVNGAPQEMQPPDGAGAGAGAGLGALAQLGAQIGANFGIGTGAGFGAGVGAKFGLGANVMGAGQAGAGVGMLTTDDEDRF